MKAGSFFKQAVLSCAFFVTAWFIAALEWIVLGERVKTLSEIMFLFVCLGLAGIYVPILIGRRYKLLYNRPSTRNNIIIGIFLFFAAAAIEIAYFSSWGKIIIENPEDLIRLKHILITVPMANAITLQFFLMTSKIVENTGLGGRTRPIVEVLLAALLMGLMLYAETGFSQIDVFLAMTAAGALICAGYILTGKFFLTFVAVLLTVYANSLSEMRYIDYSWPAAITGFIFFLIVLMIGFLAPKKNIFLFK